MITCKHCGREVVRVNGGDLIDPEATGDDAIWRETCDSNHTSFFAYHEAE